MNFYFLKSINNSNFSRNFLSSRDCQKRFRKIVKKKNITSHCLQATFTYTGHKPVKHEEIMLIKLKISKLSTHHADGIFTKNTNKVDLN